ncbi:MAG: hypothetical protein Phog2KO_29150 [Phototrophicaceae bacterium]
MSIQPNGHYYCYIRNYKTEMYLQSNASLFSNMYLIILRAVVQAPIILVPSYNRKDLDLIPELPKYLENFTSVLQTYLYAVERYKNIITPNEELAGTIEEVRINSKYYGEKVTSIFYISNEDYKTYIEEIPKIQDLFEDHYGALAHNLKGFNLIKFMNEKIISSPSFQQ